MNEIKKLITSQLAKIIKDKLGIEVAEVELAYPVFAKQGDLALACFALAKAASKSPLEIAKIIAENWEQIDEVTEVKAEGPYVNFYVNTGKLAPQLFAGFAESLENIGQAEKIMIEFANVNTHKEFHIGHLRNVAFGQAVTGLLSAVGYEVLPVSYVNDFGIHVAKTIWQLSKAPIAETAGVNRGYLLGQAYVASVAAMGESEEAKKEVSAIMTEIESRSGENYKLWQETRRWSIEYFQSIYDKLKIKFTHYYYESELIDRGRELARELLAKGVLTESQGAVIADLSAEELGVLVILRQDGTALYPVADLALAIEKFASAKLAKSLYVVDKRQSLYFKQLFAVLKKMGYEAPMIHLPYDFVTLPSGMMSSRSGNTVLFSDLYNDCKNSFSQETKARHEDWSTEKVDEVAEKLAIATLKFEMIKVSAEKIITFNINEALRFEGYTAAYLQYSCARVNSVLNKSESRKLKVESPVVSELFVFDEAAEKNLVVALAKYPEIIAEAAAKYEPSILTQYLFDVAQMFNDFYQTCPILSAGEEVKNSRLALAGHAQRVLTAGLATIGIEVIAEM